MGKIVFFEFAGREENMRVQRPHVEHLLEMYPEAEFHLWDLTRRASDQTYVREWADSHEQIRYMGGLHTGHPIRCIDPNNLRRRGTPPCRCMKHKPPYESPYRWYASQAESEGYGFDTTFVKFDDDVIWMDTEKFQEMLAFLETHPDQVASANVTNNVVCAKHEPGLSEALQEEFDLGDPLDPMNDRAWWEMHIDPIFANLSHHWLMDKIESGEYDPWDIRPPWKSRPGEAVSINFIAMRLPVLAYLAGQMGTGRLGDEGTVDATLPWVVPNFRVAHLTFGPQEQGLAHRMQKIRDEYEQLTRNKTGARA